MGRLQEATKESLASKTRRSHKKSRKGCTECKRRHIRCDESRPSCTNCRIAERACSFLETATESEPTLAPAAPAQGPPTPHLTSSNTTQQQVYPHSPADSSRSTGGGIVTPLSPRGPALPLPHQQEQQQQQHQYQEHQQQEHHQHSQLPTQSTHSLPSFNDAFAETPASSSWSPLPPAPPAPTQVSTFTSHHLMLLHHAETAMDTGILWHGHTPAIVDIAVRHSIDCPYLIDQLLAFAAVHLARQRPDASAAWRHQATELQTRAVAAFYKDAEKPNTEKTYAVPKFLFATLLSLQVMAETLEYYHSDFDVFIDRYVDCVNLHKGIRTVTMPTWADLLESELKPLLSVVNTHRPRDPSLGTECQPLHALVDSSVNLDPDAAQTCHEAARLLQWAFDLSTRLPHPEVPHAVSGFSVVIPQDFVDLLKRHVPEALVLLAYYGVLMHRTRSYWVCGNNGAYVIRAVAQKLGPYWQGHLRWPLQVLEEERD